MQQHPLSNRLSLLGFDVSNKGSYDLFTTFTDCMHKEALPFAIIKREFSNLYPSYTMFIELLSIPNIEIDSLVCRVVQNVTAEAIPEGHKYSDYDKIDDWLDKHPSQHLYFATDHIGSLGIAVSIPDSMGNGQNSGTFQQLVEDLCRFLESS